MGGQAATTDTIIALASGSGRAGVAVVRASGPGALGVLVASFRRTGTRRRVARQCVCFGTGGEFIDEAIVLWMPGPNSYTGEDIVEFHLHGGPAIIEAVLASALKSRLCRIADPGEFTRRAFEAGRLDLTQAEAIADLIDAETDGQRRQAARLYQGEAARTFEAWRGLLMSAMAALEASIDFPDEADIPGEVDLTALEPIEALAAELESALGDAGRLRSVREGFRIAILGPPNAGKSSLMNRLARREAAIVSPIAGHDAGRGGGAAGPVRLSGLGRGHGRTSGGVATQSKPRVSGEPWPGPRKPTSGSGWSMRPRTGDRCFT